MLSAPAPRIIHRPPIQRTADRRNSGTRSIRGALGFILLLSLASLGARAAPSPTIDVGSFQIDWICPKNWTVTVNRASSFAMLQYVNLPARTIAANIGVFRFIVPVKARASTPAVIAEAYIVRDVAGAGQSLFKTYPDFTLSNSRPSPLHGGEVYRFVETVEASGARTSSTLYFRAAAYFPAQFDNTGELFVLLAREQSSYLEMRPEMLDELDRVLDGLRSP